MLHFLPHYPGRDGTSSFCTGLATALNRIAPESCLVVSARRDERPAPPGVPVIRYPVSRGGPFAVAPEFLRDLRENRHQVDVVMLHGTYNPPMATLGKQLRTFGIPYVFIPHDPYVRELTRHHVVRKAIYWQIFEKPLIEGALAVQLLDASHQEPLRKRGCQVPVFVVPNGCDPEVLKQPVTSSRVPGKEAEIQVLYLGRMDRNHKGLDLLLKGFALLLRDAEESRNGLRLVLTGNDWEDRPALERLAKSLGISDRVNFTGPRRESSHQIHSEADLVVLPSRFDGFGLTIIEAMLAARPVLVSSRAGGVSCSRGWWRLGQRARPRGTRCGTGGSAPPARGLGIAGVDEPRICHEALNMGPGGGADDR
jgi:glycosyltransferase involved in cell wall biosynthesis